jgi:hypothetical protein
LEAIRVMRGRKRHRKKTFTLFVGQPRRRRRDRVEMDRAIAELDATVRAALRPLMERWTDDPVGGVAQRAEAVLIAKGYEPIGRGVFRLTQPLQIVVIEGQFDAGCIAGGIAAAPSHRFNAGAR